MEIISSPSKSDIVRSIVSSQSTLNFFTHMELIYNNSRLFMVPHLVRVRPDITVMVDWA